MPLTSNLLWRLLPLVRFVYEGLNGDGGLVIGGSGERLGLLGGDQSVTGNDLGKDATDSLDTESQGADVD